LGYAVTPTEKPKKDEKMSYRPITDQWMLTRAALKGGKKYYGAYLGGFPERARVLIGCPLDQPMLHVCGGMARHYKYDRGFGIHDRTMDMNHECEPDFFMDCRADEWPNGILMDGPANPKTYWGGMLIDPPYSEPDSDHYPPGRDAYPNPHKLIETAIKTLRVGYKVGLIHYIIPRCPKNAKFIADIGVTCGFGNRKRAFTVFERTE
jgi:hypothetical protein